MSVMSVAIGTDLTAEAELTADDPHFLARHRLSRPLPEKVEADWVASFRNNTNLRQRARDGKAGVTWSFPGDWRYYRRDPTRAPYTPHGPGK
jgi:hypothetical protein